MRSIKLICDTIQYFTRLLRFEDDLKNGHISSVPIDEYLDTEVNDTSTKTKSKGKKGKKSGHVLENQLALTEMNTRMNCGKENKEKGGCNDDS